MDKSIRVSILDREYPLRVKEDEEDRARAIAAHVEERMQGIRRRLPTEPDITVAVMAAMALADDLYSTRSLEASAHQESVSEIEKLIDSITSVVS